MAKPKGVPKLAACTPDDVFGAIKKLKGFTFYEGARHTKVTHIATGKSSTIPRHGIVKRNLLKDFIDDFLVKDCGVDTKELYKHLWC